MQFLRYLGANNTPSIAISEDGKIWRDGGDETKAVPSGMGAWPEIDPSGLHHLLPLAHLGRVFCVGLNYADHAEEMNMDAGEHPVVFTRFPESFVAHGQPIIRPHVSKLFDHEAELAVVIGKPGRHIKAKDAETHIAGYTLANDGSVRDYQKRTSQFTLGKNFEASGALGPKLVTPDSLEGGLAGRRITGRLNGEIVQESSTDNMIYQIPDVIALLSEVTTIQPGDVILTGTPGGVQMGKDNPRWLVSGDVFTVEVDGLGVLENTVAEEHYHD